MPLPFEPLQVPFRFGLAEGIDPYQAPAGTLTVANNVEWLKSGMLQKRLGANLLGNDVFGGGNLSAGARLLVRGNELCAIDGTYLYSWSTTDSLWIRMDRVPDAGLTWRTTLDSHDGASVSDIAYANGRIVQAWVVGDPFDTADLTRMLWVQIFDAETGATVLVSTPLSSQAHGVRVLYDGTQCFVLYDTLGTNIASKRISLSTFAVSAVGFLVSDKVSTAGWDALIVGDEIVLAYESTPNGNLELERFSYDSGTNTYTQEAADGITSEWGVNDDFRSIAIDGNAGEPLYVVYHSTNTGLTRIATANISTMAEITAPVTLEGTIESYNVTVKRIDASNVLAGWSAATTGPDRARATTMKLSSVLVADTTSRRGSWGTRFASRVFALGSRFFAMLSDAQVTLSSAFNGVDMSLVEIETSDTGTLGTSSTDFVPHRFLGRIDILIGGASAKGFLPSGVSLSSTVANVAVPFLSSVPQHATSNWLCGLRLARVTIGTDLPKDTWRSVEYGGELYVSASPLSVYDGRTIFDYGFPRALVVGSTNVNSPSGGSIAAGDYLYAFTREYRSAVGVLHRSPVVTTTAGNGGGTATVIIVLASCGLTTKIDVGTGTDFPAIPIVVASYRSTVGQSNYYRLTYDPSFSTIRYDVEVASQTLTDTYADTDIGGGLGIDLAARPTIYTSGGILEDEQPPIGITLALHRDRLWLVSGDKRTIWFSKSFQDDIGVAPGFSTSFRVVFDRDLVALGVLEDKLIPMAAGALWYIQGEGPAPDGSNSDFSKATRIQTDVGCSQPRSVVSTPAGLMFANDNGIYLLSRGLDVVYIGRPAQDVFDDFPIVTSAVLVSRRNQVRFTCTNEAGDEGIVLVFDYEEEQWATRSYSELGPFADSIMWEGRWTALTTDGVIVRENLESDVGAYLDEGEWVTSTIETTWISRSGPNTYQRVRRAAVLAQQQTDADHTVEIAINGSASFVENKLWQSDESFNGRVGIHIKNQKSHAIKVKVSDAEPTGVGAAIGNGQGFLWSMLALELAQKRGLEKRAEGAKK